MNYFNQSIASDETRDQILGGRLDLIQPKQGYRFSIEAVLLARFARATQRDRLLELGAGCGVVSLIMAEVWQPREVVAVELQPRLATMIERNGALNDLKVVRSVCADIRAKRIAGVAPASFD